MIPRVGKLAVSPLLLIRILRVKSRDIRYSFPTWLIGIREGWTCGLSPKHGLYVSDGVAPALWKTMPPGTTTVISVPEVAELTRVSLAPMRAARSRIPCNPKCPSFPLSTTVGSMPMPLSLTRTPRSRAYLSSTSNRLAFECRQAFRIASYPIR